MSGIINSIILAIARKRGLVLHEKSTFDDSYSGTGLNPTAIGANVITGIALDDSDIFIRGSNKRAKALQDMATYYTDDIRSVACETALGTGDVIIRPYTDGINIGLNIIQNKDFAVVSAIGNHLKAVIMKLGEYKTNIGDVYRLFELQELQAYDGKSTVRITRYAFKNSNEVPIESTNWAGFTKAELITADQLLLGRYKCPTINRNDINGNNGVPLTYGCEDIIENIRKRYRDYNDEFDQKKSKIFADRTLFNRDSKDPYKLKLDGSTFVKVNSSIDGGVGSSIEDYSPAIRETEQRAGNDFNFSVLEMCCGFSRGIFTSPETSFATATEMKNSLKKTFSFVQKFRRSIEFGDRMLFRALDIMMNLNGTSPVGDYDIDFQWSYDYIEETKERFNQLMQGHSIGAVKTEDVTAWVMDLTEEESKKYLAELEEEERNKERDLIEHEQSGAASSSGIFGGNSGQSGENSGQAE